MLIVELDLFSRVRRFAALDALVANGVRNCSHGVQRKADGHVSKRYLDADFVLAPQGKGRANYREWEALAAGAVPLVDWDASDAMARLYDGLPVVRVRDWRDITPAALDAELANILAANDRGEIDLKKLYLPYWLAQFTSHLAPAD